MPLRTTLVLVIPFSIEKCVIVIMVKSTFLIKTTLIFNIRIVKYGGGLRENIIPDNIFPK